MNEAERLIKEHEDDDWIARTVQWRDEAATELRRLLAINAELEAKIKKLEACKDKENMVYMDSNFRMST